MQAIADADIAKIASAASALAGQLGYAALDARIKGAIKQVRIEFNTAFFTRLVGHVNSKFGTGILREEVVEDLNLAWRLRGVAAHGQRANIDDTRAFQKSLFALEALCFLLTAGDLPLSTPRRGRIGEHGLVRNYRLCQGA